MSKQVPKVGDLIEVYWWDHSSRDQWENKGQKTDVIECRSVGWVDRVDRIGMQLYSNETDGGRISQQFIVVRSCITRLIVLKRAKQAAPKWTKVKG